MVRPGGQSIVARIFIRLVGDQRDFLHALGRDLMRDRLDGEIAFMLLAAGHGDDAVEENLEGDVGLGRDREADGERARMIIGAVAEILEHMRARRERRLADPIGALAAHMGVALGRAVHPLRHVMATDARIGARALRHMGRGAMRTAGAKMRHAHRHLGHRQRALPAKPRAARRAAPVRRRGDISATGGRWRWRRHWRRARP